MFCQKCGRQLIDGVRFCGGCGAPAEYQLQSQLSMNAGVRPPQPAVNGIPPVAYQSQMPKKKKPIWIAAVIGAVVAAVALVVLVLLLVESPKGSSAPRDAYDIAGIVGMNPSDMAEWFESNDFAPMTQGADTEARFVVNDDKTYPAPDYDTGTSWETLWTQAYNVFSALPSGTGINGIFNLGSDLISPADFARSTPRAAFFMTVLHAEYAASIPTDSHDYLMTLLDQAQLTPTQKRESLGKIYAIGKCRIGTEDGAWIAYAERGDDGYLGGIVCGYANDMMAALSVDTVDSATLTGLLGTSPGSSSTYSYSPKSSSSNSSPSSSSSSARSSSSSSSSSARSSSNSGGSSTNGGTINLVGTWRDPDYPDSTMTLKSDGTGEIIQNGSVFSGRWKEVSNGIQFEIGGSLSKTYFFELGMFENKLSLYNSEKQLLFQR